MILLDTNVLGRLTDSRDAHWPAARRAVQELARVGEQLVIVPQNLFEFWAIATRKPAVNGLGMTVEQASQWLASFRRRFALMPDRDDLHVRWHELQASSHRELSLA